MKLVRTEVKVNRKLENDARMVPIVAVVATSLGTILVAGTVLYQTYSHFAS